MKGKNMKHFILAAAILLAACTPQQTGFVGVQTVQSPLHDPAQPCKRFYLDSRCLR